MTGIGGGPDTEQLADRFRRWAAAGVRVGAPLTAHLLARAADDIARGGALRLVLQPFSEEPGWRELPLRLLAQVHRRVLRGELPELARHYPSVGGELGPDGAWPLFCRACVERAQELQLGLAEPLLTDDVGRVAALIGGFLQVARETARPLRLLELGAGAGFQLRWDHFRSARWLPGLFEVAPPLEGKVKVVERRGCDSNPVDPTTEEGALLLKSFVWPDLADRRRMLEAALEVCRRVPAPVDRAEGSRWLGERLAEAWPETATVVFRSVGSQYPAQVIRQAAEAVTPRSPLAWLRLEPAARRFEVRLRLWPGGEDRLLATTEGDGRAVTWLA
jgi:hypothetical protein